MSAVLTVRFGPNPEAPELMFSGVGRRSRSLEALRLFASGAALIPIES